MKKTMRRLTAAMLALTCVTATAAPAVYAEEPNLTWYWGTAETDDFANMERVDDGTWTNELNGSRELFYVHPIERADGTMQDEIVCVRPRDNTFKFTRRSDVDDETFKQQLLEVLDKYYPGIKDAYDQEHSTAVVPASAASGPIKDRDYELFGSEFRDYRKDGCSAEVADNICKELAARRLISEFYSWGQTAYYAKQYPYLKNVLTFYSNRTEYIADLPLDFTEESSNMQALLEMMEQNHVDHASFRDDYAEGRMKAEFPLLVFENGDCQCVKMNATDESGNVKQFFKVTSGDHVQYYADGNSMRAAVRWLTELPEGSDLVKITDQTIGCTYVPSTAGVASAEKPITVKIDLEPLRQYLDEHYPGYEIESIMDGAMFQIHLQQPLSTKESLQLGKYLQNRFGVPLYTSENETANPPVFGKNEMEQPGDANLDCKVDILDVIAANKHILGVGTLDKTGLKNADIDGNGTADAEDSLAILKAALDIAD